jgi:hypothetical protein
MVKLARLGRGRASEALVIPLPCSCALIIA